MKARAQRMETMVESSGGAIRTYERVGKWDNEFLRG